MYVSGIAPPVPFAEISTEIWDDTMDTNLRGGFLVSKAVTPHMVAQGRGNLVFMASTNCWDGEASLATTMLQRRDCTFLPRPWPANSANTAFGPMLWDRASSKLA